MTTEWGTGDSRARRCLLATAIAAMALVVYLPALRGGFAWDDSVQVTDNPLIRDPAGLRRIWFGTEGMDYFPLTLASHWVEWRLWGLRAGGYHAVNVLLHAISAILVWRVLKRLSVSGAWLAGAFFAVHPVAADSVAWIAERKNTLSMALYLAALLAWMKAEGRVQNAECRMQNGTGIALCALFVLRSALCTLRSAFCTPSYLFSLALFLLALLAKTSVVILPFVLLLCAWWRRGGVTRRDIMRSLPFFALAIALGLVTIEFQQHNAIHGMTVRSEGAASRLAASGWIAWFYLCKLLLPVGLCAIYPRWNVDGASVGAYLPLALLAAGAIWLLLARRKQFGRATCFAAAYFLIALLPVLGIVNMLFMGLSLAADHFQYLAMIGVIAFAAAVLARAASSPGWLSSAGVAASVGCVAVLGILTWHRAGLYGDEERLWLDNLARNPSAAVCNALGVARSHAGRHQQALESLDEAIRLRPDLAEYRVNRAAAFEGIGRFEEALRDYDAALKLRSQDAAIYNGRGNVLARMNRPDEAIWDYDAAIALRQDYGLAYYNRGNVHFNAGRLDLALDDYDQAVQFRPDYARAWNNRAAAEARLGRADEALRDFSRSLALDPGNPGAWYSRAHLYADRKEYDKALADVQMFEKLGGHPDPDFVKSLSEAASTRRHGGE